MFDGVLKERLGGKTVILVTHNQDILKQVDEVIIMRDGEIRVSGSFEHVKTHGEFLHYTSTRKVEVIPDLASADQESEQTHSEKSSIKKSLSSVADMFKSLKREEGLLEAPNSYNYGNELERLHLM